MHYFGLHALTDGRQEIKRFKTQAEKGGEYELSTIMMHAKIIMQEQLYARVKEKPTGRHIRINDFKGLCETL